MRNSAKLIKSYTIDPEIGHYVAITKGSGSASERVNALLRRAMLQEQEERLEAEADAFFAAAKGKRRKDTLDWQEAALRTLMRD